jgi:hypothetical protein
VSSELLRERLAALQQAQQQQAAASASSAPSSSGCCDDGSGSEVPSCCDTLCIMSWDEEAALGCAADGE